MKHSLVLGRRAVREALRTPDALHAAVAQRLRLTA